jgi:hypothetical protein
MSTDPPPSSSDIAPGVKRPRGAWLRDRQISAVVVGVLIAVGLGSYGLIAASKSERVVLWAAPLAVIIAYLLVYQLLDRFEGRFTRSLDSRLPPVEYLEVRHEVEAALTRLVRAAQQYVVAVGGRSRNSDYLSGIEAKVHEAEIRYWRLLLDGQPITHQMCEHLRRLLTNADVVIAAIPNRGYAQVTVTDAGFVSVLPLPGRGALTGILVPNPAAAQQLFIYTMVIYGSGTRVTDGDAIRNLCEDCRTDAEGS